MVSVYRFVAMSGHPAARAARSIRQRVLDFTLPAPRPLVLPIVWTFLALRAAYYFAVRVFVCEPFFKASCRRCGRGVRTGVYIHWIQGPGQIIVGDGVLVDGKCAFSFAARYCESPTLEIGDLTEIGHGCRFTVGKRITIGRRCHLSSSVWMFDSSGHPSDAGRRAAGLPADDADVRPITLGNDVWIGSCAMIHPGVSLGDGCVVSAGSVVLTDVPPNTIVAGNPARQIVSLPRAVVSRPEAAANGRLGVART
ncbi:acyltransferase [Paludisphaera rhizosphaerae]|uniref:acyltransferase n=1 Tax=Paludisphaera rhizosphaerae TaxID=2711216 RepID=UPI0013EC1BFE|nr:acyltransferase [Paludisphaera rhizosphaerae]